MKECIPGKKRKTILQEVLIEETTPMKGPLLESTKARVSCHCMPLPRGYDLTIKSTPGFVPFVTG
jgi:hypothetical protein